MARTFHTVRSFDYVLPAAFGKMDERVLAGNGRASVGGVREETLQEMDERVLAAFGKKAFGEKPPRLDDDPARPGRGRRRDEEGVLVPGSWGGGPPPQGAGGPHLQEMLGTNSSPSAWVGAGHSQSVGTSFPVVDAGASADPGTPASTGLLSPHFDASYPFVCVTCGNDGLENHFALLGNLLYRFRQYGRGDYLWILRDGDKVGDIYQMRKVVRERASQRADVLVRDDFEMFGGADGAGVVFEGDDREVVRPIRGTEEDNATDNISSDIFVDTFSDEDSEDHIGHKERSKFPLVPVPPIFRSSESSSFDVAPQLQYSHLCVEPFFRSLEEVPFYNRNRSLEGVSEGETGAPWRRIIYIPDETGPESGGGETGGRAGGTSCAGGSSADDVEFRRRCAGGSRPCSMWSSANDVGGHRWSKLYQVTRFFFMEIFCVSCPC